MEESFLSNQETAPRRRRPSLVAAGENEHNSQSHSAIQGWEVSVG